MTCLVVVVAVVVVVVVVVHRTYFAVFSYLLTFKSQEVSPKFWGQIKLINLTQADSGWYTCLYSSGTNWHTYASILLTVKPGKWHQIISNFIKYEIQNSNNPDEGSVPEMRIWSILLIKSALKWCIHLSRSLFLYFNYLVSVTAGGPVSPRGHM